MKEHPIIFSGDMVRAILDGRKTQTRRVIKPQPKWIEDVGGGECVPYVNAEDNPIEIQCPHGQPGNHLWVRETFSLPLLDSCYRAKRNCPQITYAADGESRWPSRKRPSIHMPRWASRITLEVTGIRIQRVQDITEADAWSEGFPDPPGTNKDYPDRARYWFQQLWNSINAKRGFSWDVNPWVWVIEFKRIK